MLKLSFSLLLFTLYYSSNAEQCSNLGGLGVFHDPTCSSGGGAGCNAGGQGVNCRFCGFVFIINRYDFRKLWFKI
jgi:hypothetical protein